MEVTIRRATAADYPALSRVLQEADRLHCEHLPHLFRATEGPVRSRDHIESLLQKPEALVLVAEAGGEVVGCVIANLHATPPIPVLVPRRTVMVDTLAVLAAWRRRRVGRALMKGVHAWAQGNAADEVELYVYEFNAEAIAFYRELGYQTVARRMARKSL